MRKFLYYIENGDKEHNYPTGEVMVRDAPLSVNKGDTEIVTHRNIESGEQWKVTYTGLGYKDFDDEKDYENNSHNILKERVENIIDENK